METFDVTWRPEDSPRARNRSRKVFADKAAAQRYFEDQGYIVLAVRKAPVPRTRNTFLTR